jgi:hypothetical protein
MSVRRTLPGRLDGKLRNLAFGNESDFFAVLLAYPN